MIRRSLNRLVNWAQNYGIQSCQTKLVDNDASRIGARGMNFTLYSANGGHVLEYRRYDDKLGESINNLHIINSGEDMGEKISQIVTLELLRN